MLKLKVDQQNLLSVKKEKNIKERVGCFRVEKKFNKTIKPGQCMDVKGVICKNTQTI